MGGNVPLGYDVTDRKLIVNEPEAATVRLIFQRYAELGSVALLKAELERARIVSRRREGADGELSGGQHFSRGALYLMLQNRIYRGEIVHQGTAYPGQHKAIIDPELWRIVQDKLTANRHERSLAVGAEPPSMLAGLIVDADGNRMTPTHATKKAKRYRYYVSTSLLAGDRPQAQKGMHVPAGDIEGLVLDRLRCFSRPGLTSLTRSHRSSLMLARLMGPCATLSSFQSDGSPCRPSRGKASPRKLSSG
jgi:site-specific DNA recombinase